MDEMLSDSQDSELKHTAMAEAFENLRRRLKQTGDEFASTRTTLQTRFEALQTREEEIGRREKLLEGKETLFRSKEAELEAIEEAITEKVLDFEEGKRHLKSLEINEKEKECDLLRNRIENGERDLARVQKSVEEMETKMRESLEDWKCKVELKERELEERLLEKLRLKEELLEPNVDELHHLVNDVEECINEVNRREREVVSKGKEVELAEMRVNEGRNEVQRKVDERRYEVELKEKHLCAMEKLIEDNRKGLDSLMRTAEERKKEMELLKKSLEDRERNMEVASEELKRKERELQQQAEALELKRVQFDQQLAFAPEANNAIVLSPVGNISLDKAEEPNSSLSKHGASFLSSNLQSIANSYEGCKPCFVNENSSGNKFIRNVVQQEHRKRKMHKNSQPLVTYTEMDVSRNASSQQSKRPKTIIEGSSSAPSMAALATHPVPKIQKAPIGQILDKYGCADEKFVRTIIKGLKGIEPDLLKYRNSSPAANLQAARELMMKALFAFDSMDHGEDDCLLKEQVASLTDRIDFLSSEKTKLENEKTAFGERLAKLKMRKQELEVQAKRATDLEVKRESLQAKVDMVRGELKSKEAELQALKAALPGQCEQAVSSFKEAALNAARYEAITEKFREWTRHGYLNHAKMSADLAKTREAKKLKKAAQAETEGSKEVFGSK